MRRLIPLIIAFVALVHSGSAAVASIVARVDLSAQVMHVYVNGAPAFVWRVSTGARGYLTPAGVYRPTILKRMHYSQKYDNSPMPHAIFFRGGYAIHGTGYVRQLGRPASHGCIRLHPAAAARLFALVQRHGRAQTRIVIAR